MNRIHRNTIAFALLIAPLLFGLAAPVKAEPAGRAWMTDDSYREQMMREFGTGMMGPGYGMMHRGGPGYGYGYGYDNEYGRHPMMGPGMMGPGMMMGMGPMMSAFDELNLNKEQRKQVWQLRRELRDQHMKLMDRMWEESEKMEDLSAKDKPDPKEVGKAYDRVFAMQREMIELNVAFKNKLFDLLTDEQRKKLKTYGPGWMME